MLKSCFVGSLAPKWAENILIRKKPGTYLVRQSDLDPDLLLLSYVEKDIKHVIVPELHSAPIFSKKTALQRKLEDESAEVQKLLESFGCKHPVTSDSESQPSHFKVKTRPEDGTLHRCSVCTFESGDVKKVKRHRDSHRVSHCHKCDGFFLQKNLTRHKIKCLTVKIHKCDFDEQKCDFSSPREYE